MYLIYFKKCLAVSIISFSLSTCFESFKSYLAGSSICFVRFLIFLGGTFAGSGIGSVVKARNEPITSSFGSQYSSLTSSSYRPSTLWFLIVAGNLTVQTCQLSQIERDIHAFLLSEFVTPTFFICLQLSRIF